MLAHIALCVVLRMLLRGDAELSSVLFLAPNAWLGFNLGPKLLRAKYFMPRAQVPEEMNEQSLSVRATFLLARTSGGLVPLLLLAFLGYGVYTGVRQ